MMLREKWACQKKRTSSNDLFQGDSARADGHDGSGV